MSKIERFLSDPRYQALDAAGKKDKLDLFFNKYVTQDARYAPLDEEGKARVYSKFMSKYYGDPEAKSHKQNEPDAKAPKQKTPFTDLGSEVENITSLTTSAEAISTGLVETQTLDRRNKAYQKVMADREEALRIIDRERNLKHVVPQDRVAAGQQYIKKVESMQGAYKYPIKSQYTAAMERLQPNNYTDPIERQVAHEIVNKEKLDKAQREYQRIAERMASATPEERKEIAKSLAAQQTLIDYYATGMTAAERAAYQAGQEGSESFRMVKALGAGAIDLASGVYQLFNPDSKFARTINAYSAGLLEQSGNPLEDAFAQVFYSMPMTLGYFMTSGISGAAGTATKAAAIATKAGEVASLMHSVNINAYMTAKKYSEAISGYGSATAVPEGVLLAGSTSALVESAIEMLSDTAQAKIVLGQAKRIGRRGAEQIIKNSLSGKIAGYGTRLATGMAESATTEFLEEITQGASGMIFDVMSNQREVPSLEEAFKELLYSGAVGALGGITFGLGGGIMVQSSNYQNWREVKKQAASGNKHAARLWEARSILDKSNPNGEVTKSDVQRAYDVIKSDLHAVTENRYQEDNPSIAQAMAQMYDAYAMVDMIKSPQQEAVREAIEAGVQRILDQKQATATQEPTQQATESEPQSVEDTIVTLVQEGDIEAAENALNEAIKNGTTGINIPYLRTLVNESKAVAARIAKEEADQKARQDIIDKYGKYAEMSHSELQDEAKKRGLKAGGKSTDIMARLKESDEKPKAETTPAKPAAKKPLTANELTEQQQDRAIKESLIAEETPKKASKYESMGYNALQKEAKKHGINSFGVKKAELIRQLEEKRILEEQSENKDKATADGDLEYTKDKIAETRTILTRAKEDLIYYENRLKQVSAKTTDMKLDGEDITEIEAEYARYESITVEMKDYIVQVEDELGRLEDIEKDLAPQKTQTLAEAAEDIESEVMSSSTFQEQYRQAQEWKLPKGQIDAQLKLYDAMMDTYAKEMGITIDEAYAEVIDSVTADEPVEGTARRSGARYQTIQGYIQKMPNGKYRIGIMQPNVTTGLHEQAHLGKSLMEIMANKSPVWASRLKAAEEWCVVKDGKWTTEAEEKFANGYVKFLADGSAPNGKLKTIFAKIKEWIGSILQGLADVKNLDVSNEMRGVYLSMLGISEGKRNLTSEQKVQSIKLKSAMKQDATSDPLKLETEIDSFADSNDLILEGKRTGNKTSFYLNRIDDGKTMIEIHHSNGEYEVNGYHAANNQEVMEQITRILGDTRYQTTGMPSAAEIAEAERQMAEVRAKYEGTDQWLKAPNGKKTNLNERQWLQVRTENFKNWFGDWENDPKNASKVVDENGEPLVVYHGGTVENEFSPDKSRRGFFFFAEDKEAAKYYADTYNARLLEVFLSSKNILDLSNPYSDTNEEFMREYTDYYDEWIDRGSGEETSPQELIESGTLWDYEGTGSGNRWYDLFSLAKSMGHDGVKVNDVTIRSYEPTYVVFSPAQIKSATGNVGTFSESNDIRYQIDNAIQSASPDMQDRIAKIMEKQKKVQQAANATYRELTTKIGRTTSVYEWDSMMRKSLVTAIRNAFPGAAPMNIEKYAALEETLGELDPGLEDHAKEIKRIKAQLRRMVAMDKKFRDALEDVSGFSDIADIPFEGLFSALENTNPAAYDRYFKDETFDILLKALPKIKTAYDGQFTMQTLQRIVDVILNGNDPNVGRDVSELAFLQPQRLFAELFGKAGINTINYAYHGTLKLAAYEMEYTPHLRELNRLLMTSDNNRGSAYDGDDLDIIGRTIFEVDGNSEISNKLETIQERLAEWAEENNAVINSKDVEEIYNEKEYLKDIMRGFIAEWNANPERTQKIGIREDYDNPRKYNWGDISDITTKGGKYLYTPGNARERSKQDFSEGLDYDTNIFNAYSNYMYSMTRYMAFYDLANYVEGSSILYASKGGKAGQKKMASGFDLDLSLAQHKSSAYASKMIEDYVRNTIGYHKKDTPKGRLLASARTNVYVSLLAANVIMTVLNYNQRNLIHSVVDQNIAMQVRTDVAFWTGLFKPSNEEYPTLSGIMQAYVTANQSLVAEMAAEAKRSANQGRTALTRAYYKHSAYNAEMLRLSPFSLAELGNRAYAHAAGVYQVTQNSMAYKEYVASGMSRHQAMERALSEDSNLRRAAITYGGIINAEINADANRAFSPHFFGDASKIKKVAVFLRYGVTIALLELRTYGGARDIKSLLSPDLFRLLTSGNVKAATAAQTIQAGAIMKSMLHPKRIAELVRKGQVSTAKTSKNLITVNEVNMVRDAITWALDVQAKHTEGEFHNIIRGKSGAKQAMAALMAFSVSEVLLRSLLELLFSLIPWWKGKKKFIETDVIENIASVLGLFQGLKTASNVRLGSTLAPDLGVYNPTAKTTTKALSQYVLRLTPYAGFANYMGKVFTGKYFSDLFWDEVYD